MPRTTPVLLIALALVLGPLTGCVTKGRYNEVVSERDELHAENQKLRSGTRALARQGAQLSIAVTELSEQLALRDAQMAQLEKEQAELAEELETWVVAGLIKMELLKDGLHLILSEEILFPTGSADVSDTGKEVIGKLVAELEQLPYQVAVLGYSDNVPIGGNLAARYPSNWELAGARAAGIVRVMEQNGITSARLAAVSFGENRPIASNDTPEGRAENRRIEVRLRPVIIE